MQYVHVFAPYASILKIVGGSMHPGAGVAQMGGYTVHRVGLMVSARYLVWYIQNKISIALVLLGYAYYFFSLRSLYLACT